MTEAETETETETTEGPPPEPKPRPVALQSLNTLVQPEQILLETTFAADQLHIIANKDSLAMFMAVYVEIFGIDIPSEAYEALYKDAQANADVLRHETRVVPSIEHGAKAKFDAREPTVVSVLESAVLDALYDNDAMGELMTMLVEEYGHMLDHLLRNHYAQTEDDDAEGDEGAKFTYKMYTINPIESSDQHFADATIDGKEVPMVWDFSELHESLKEHVDAERQAREDKIGSLEFFKAGRIAGPHGYGHQDIMEEALGGELMPHVGGANLQKTIDIIYLGNWLRDFSQAVDPMIVRPMSAAAAAAASDTPIAPGSITEGTTVQGEVPTLTLPESITGGLNPMNYVTNRSVEFRPVLLSVEAITTMIELAATKEFIHREGTTVDDTAHYQGHLHKLRTEFVPVDTEALGAYRPEEHIDNPKGLGQSDTGGSRGDKALYSKFIGHVPDNHALHNINKDFGAKNYIRATSGSFPVDGASCKTAYEYIVSKLRASGRRGGLRNPQALVDFGAAMHTLEDYFAHTNFAELSLIKSVEPMVFPWVDEVKSTGFKYQFDQLRGGGGLHDRYAVLAPPTRAKPGNRLATQLPLVTGTFGLVDTAASVLPILNEHIFSVEIEPWKKAEYGERTFADILVRELLADIDKVQKDEAGNTGTNDTAYADAFDRLLAIRDTLSRVADFLVPDAIERGFHWVTEHIRQLLNFSQYFLIKSIAAVLNDAQVALDKDLDVMETGTFYIGDDPSHTQVAKDDPHHPVHGLAAKLAVEAVRRVGREMVNVWNGRGTVAGNVVPVLDALMRHPAETDWQDSIVVAWAGQNRSKVCDAATPSIVVGQVMHALEEIDETLGNIDTYLSDDTATGKVISFFTDDQEVKDDINYLKRRVQRSIRISREQGARARRIKAVWDAKYPKPSYCN